MKRRRIATLAAIAAVFGVWSIVAGPKQDRYSLQVPDGLSFSEFRGYETWELVSVSHSDETLNVILGNPVMIKAYQDGYPGNGKPWPDGAKNVKIQYFPKQSKEAPFDVAIPDGLKDVAFMAKDGKRFADSGGWGYAQFDYDAASDSFKPNGKGTKCGAACHSTVKAKDYVFTAFGKR